MHRPTIPQSAGSLVTVALNEHQIYDQLRVPNGDYELIAVNNCSDNRAIKNKMAHIERVTGIETIQVSCFGGLNRLSPYSPGYRKSDAEFMLGELKTAAVKRDARLIIAGAHGDECAWCNAMGVTVAQRQWLSADAKGRILRAAEREHWAPVGKSPIRVCLTWHRRWLVDDQVHHRTRVIRNFTRLFDLLSIRDVMRLNDREVIERLSPHLLGLVACR